MKRGELGRSVYCISIIHQSPTQGSQTRVSRGWEPFRVETESEGRIKGEGIVGVSRSPVVERTGFDFSECHSILPRVSITLGSSAATVQPGCARVREWKVDQGDVKSRA